MKIYAQIFGMNSLQKFAIIIMFPLILGLAACGGGDESNTNAPVISGTPARSIRADSNYSFTPSASDADGNWLSFEITNKPGWATFNTRTGELSGTPAASDLGDTPDIVISVTDSKFTTSLASFSLLVLPPLLNASNFVPQGIVTPTANGYQATGALTLTTDTTTVDYENSDLFLDFDSEGKLLSFSGTTDLPTRLSDTVTVEPGIQSDVGMMTGAQINADPSFGIKLIDEATYFVFRLSTAVDITIENPDSPGGFETITLTTPAAGEIILITDPSDPMFYRYASTPIIGAYGTGSSSIGMIPFTPVLDFLKLDSFYGHSLEKGQMSFGFKVFDFFSVSGSRVIKDIKLVKIGEPLFGLNDIDWQDPFNSPIEYKAGFNGDLDFSFAVLSVGLFSFDLVETSGTLDVGFDRQQAAIAMLVAPDVSWVPAWFPYIPTTEARGQAFINGDTSFLLALTGNFESTVPPAEVSATMAIDNNGTTMTGTTVNGGDQLSVSVTFADNETVGRVQFPASYGASITDDVSAALDRQFAALDQALQDLQTATANYQFEVSLRGLRSTLPAMMDAAVIVLNGIPNKVYDEAYAAAFNTVAGNLLLSNANKVLIATAVADTAKIQAYNGTLEPIAAMKELKIQALKGDDAALRVALSLALDAVYQKRTYSKRIKVDYSVLGILTTLYDVTYTATIINATNAAKIKTARDNVWQIAATSDIMVSAQQIYDAMPLKETITAAKAQVDNGLAAIPIPEGLGYRTSDGTYEAFITVGGVDHSVGFNVLSASDVQTGVSDFFAGQLTVSP